MNSLHLTIGGNNVEYGDRTPAIWPSINLPNKMYIASAVNGQQHVHRPARPPVGVWTPIEIAQTLEQGKYMYRIVVGGEEVHAVENTEPKEFQDVKVYASGPWHEAQPGSIRNLVIRSKYQGGWVGFRLNT